MLSSNLVTLVVPSSVFLFVRPALSVPSFFPSAGGASAYATNADRSYNLTEIAGPSQISTSSINPPSSGNNTFTLNIDDTSSGHKQTIDGFGAAVTDATTETFDTLSSGTLNQLLDTLLTTNGVGADFALFRHTIGASDLTGDPVYTYDDNGSNGTPDVNLDNFTLTDRGTAMAKLLAQMQAKKSGLEILGSVWSPPGWMKINKVIDGTTVNNNLQDQYLEKNQTNYAPSFAQYFVKYIKAFANLGASVAQITIQNEPLNSQAGYPTMYMFAEEQAELVQNYVGPALKNAGLSTSVWAYDHNTDVPSFPQTVLDGAGDYVNTVAWHCYAGSVNWDTLTQFRAANPSVSNLKQYMTECWTPATTNSDWFQAANFTIGPLQNYANGVIAWTLGVNAQDGPHLTTGGCATCQGLVQINSDGTYELQLAYYLIAQFSKFIPKGATVLNTTGYSPTSYNPGLQAVSSLNSDGSRTVVLMNTLTTPLTVTANFKSGQAWRGSIPSQSVVTWVLPSTSASGQNGWGFGGVGGWGWSGSGWQFGGGWSPISIGGWGQGWITLPAPPRYW